MRFLYPSRMEKWILRTIGDRWRQHKSNLKSVYFDANKSMEVNCSNVPNGVIGDQWIALVNNWMSQKSKVQYTIGNQWIALMQLIALLHFLIPW